MTELIKNFNELGKDNAAIAGGKGASLGEMAQAGFPVPNGFVLLATAFEQFLKETDLNVEIDSILHKVNHQEMHTVEHASEKIQKLILEAKIPEYIVGDIKNEFAKLNSKYIAVRSSAMAKTQALRLGRDSLKVTSTRLKRLYFKMFKSVGHHFSPRERYFTGLKRVCTIQKYPWQW